LSPFLLCHAQPTPALPHCTLATDLSDAWGDDDVEKHNFEAVCLITFDNEFEPADKNKI
jgi:hypothetical protein